MSDNFFNHRLRDDQVRRKGIHSEKIGFYIIGVGLLTTFWCIDIGHTKIQNTGSEDKYLNNATLKTYTAGLLLIQKKHQKALPSELEMNYKRYE